MAYKEIDMTTFSRRDHFTHFTSMSYPYVGVTVPVDVSGLLAYCRRHHASFFLTMLHVAVLAANDVPQLRQRIHGGGIREYEFCHSSHTELLPDQTYCYCTVRHDLDFASYMAQALRARKQALEAGSIDESEDVDSLIFVSSLPWLPYTEMIQPVAGGEDTNPRISWGQYEADGTGRVMMPVSILAHHALVDGVHLGLFYQRLKKRMIQLVEIE